MNVGFLAKTKWPAIRQGTPAGNEMRTARSVVGQIGPFCVGFLLGIKRSYTIYRRKQANPAQDLKIDDNFKVTMFLLVVY